MKMKSSSSSSSLSFTSKTHTFGCISLILQKFLSSGTSSTYPSDQITAPGFESPDFNSEPPGAVARLMGLDSIPLETRVVSRSRSVNSLDCVENEIQGKHRRVKSTLDSYQFDPEYVELEDDRFFILSFDKDRNEKGFGELKQLGCENQSETENRTCVEAKENNINTSPGCERLEIREVKHRRKEKRKSTRKKRRENIEKENLIKSYSFWSRDGDSLANCEVRSTNEEEECGGCDDSSPVSVLDYGRVYPEPENSSRKSSKRNETIQEDNISRESQVRLLHDFEEMWLMICRLTVSEIEGSKWVYGKASKLQDFEGIVSEDIVSNILDQLLEETITTLSRTSQL